jgi:hypothetical protein
MVELPPDSTLTSARLAELLAPTLGWEKSLEVVDAAASRLGLSPNELSVHQGLSVLDELARTPGMVGIAARFARSRLDANRAPPPAAAMASTGPISARIPRSSPHAADVASGARSAPRPAEPPASSTARTTVTAGEVAALLSSAMGAEKATETVLNAARRLGFAPERLDKVQAIALLDHLAAEPGIVGLCARFGKARLILRFAA